MVLLTPANLTDSTNHSPRLPIFANFHKGRRTVHSRNSAREPRQSAVREVTSRAGSEGNAVGNGNINCCIAVRAMKGRSLDTIIWQDDQLRGMSREAGRRNAEKRRKVQRIARTIAHILQTTIQNPGGVRFCPPSSPSQRSIHPGQLSNWTGCLSWEQSGQLRGVDLPTFI